MKRKELFDEEGLRLFVNRLKQLRMEKKMSQDDLCGNSGLTHSTIARIEALKTNPSLSTVFQIARGLNVPLSEIFNFELPPKELPA